MARGECDRVAKLLMDWLGGRGGATKFRSLPLTAGLESLIIIIIDTFCIALFSGVPKLTALYILQHFLSFTNIIHIIMTTNNV